MVSSIASASIALSLAQTQQAAGVAVTKKIMEQQELQGNAIIQQMQQLPPSFGHQLDILA